MSGIETLPDSDRLPRLAAEIAWLGDQAVQAAGAVTGAQVYVAQGPTVLADVAVGVDGQGRPMTVSTLAQMRCAVAKPLIAMAVATFVAEGRCDWTTPLGDILRGELHPDVAACTLDDILCHRAGLHTMPALLLNLRSPDYRLHYARTTRAARGWRRGVDSAYGEACHALLSGAVVEELAGADYREVVNERILGPSGIAARHLRTAMSDREFDDLGPAIGATCARVNGVDVPFLVEATRRQATEWNPSWSGFASATGLALVFRHLRDLELGIASNPWLPQATVRELLSERPQDPAGRHQSDRFTMGRGVHHRLRIVQVPPAYAGGTFGHFGWAIALGFVDRQLDLTVGLRFANQCDDVLNLMRIDRLVTAIYDDLGDPDRSDGDPLRVPDPEIARLLS